jgi:hypothetical protein
VRTHVLSAQKRPRSVFWLWYNPQHIIKFHGCITQKIRYSIFIASRNDSKGKRGNSTVGSNQVNRYKGSKEGQRVYSTFFFIGAGRNWPGTIEKSYRSVSSTTINSTQSLTTPCLDPILPVHQSSWLSLFWTMVMRSFSLKLRSPSCSPTNA